MVRNQNTGRFQRTNANSKGSKQKTGPATGGGVGQAITPAIGIIAGAGIGAALMFLLDPEKGKNRRRYLTDAAGRAAGSTGHAVGSAWETVGGKAHAVRTALADTLPSRDDIRQAGEHLLHRAGDATSTMRDVGQSALDSAHTAFDSAMSQAESYLPQRRASRRFSPASATAAGVTAAGAVAMGLGAMWLFHPTAGRDRRARIVSAVSRVANDTCDMARAAGRRVKGQASAYAHQATSMFHCDDEVAESEIEMIDQVRADIAKLGLDGSSVAIDLQDDAVVLVGRCRAEDMDRILSVARALVGDREVINRLDLSERAETDAGIVGI